MNIRFRNTAQGRCARVLLAAAAALASSAHAQAWQQELPASGWFDAAFGVDGSVYVATWRAEAPQWEVRRISSSGTFEWSTTPAQGDGTAITGGLAFCGEELICVSPEARLVALDRETGTGAWTAALTGDGMRLQQVAGGVSAYAYVNGGFGENLRFERFDESGAPEASGAAAGALFLAMNPEGAIAFRNNDLSLGVLGADGTIAPLLAAGVAPPPFTLPQFRPAIFDAEGTLTYLSLTEDGALSVARASEDGVVFNTGITTLNAGETVTSVRLVAAGDGGTYGTITLQPSAPATAATRALVFAVDGEGTLSWRRGVTAEALDDPWLAAAANDRHLLLATPAHDGDLLMLRNFDPADGSLQSMELLSCAGAPCNKVRATIDDHGTAYVVAGSSGGPVRINGDLDLSPRATVTVEQPGLSGQWYAPHTAGQGISVRYFEDARTLFLAWFTYSHEGGDDAEALRWYTLQTTVPPGARAVTLPIYQGMNGQFGEPGYENIAVGTAELRFETCREGLLEYRFDDAHNGGRTGSIELHRLTPLDTGCMEADGTAATPEAAADLLLGGHWFDPATAGQGLDLSRALPDGQEAGVLFGTWFTYDPQAPSSEPADQHWFTLQAEEPSPEGAIRAAIIQTFDGRFDSGVTQLQQRVGTVELRSQACDRLTLDYAFDDSAAAGGFRGLSGTQALVRVDACPGD